MPPNQQNRLMEFEELLAKALHKMGSHVERSSRSGGEADMLRKGIPEKVGMLISGHRTDSVYRRYNIVDMEVLKTATAKIEEHQREIVQAENNHRTAIVSTETGADDKGKQIN